MRIRKFWRFFIAILALVLIGRNPASAEFLVWQQLSFNGAPDFRSIGIKPLKLLGDAQLGKEGIPSVARVFESLKGQPFGSLVVIDIERWPLDGSQEARKIAVDSYRQTINHFRNVRPDVKVGLYSAVPIRDFWRAIGAKGPSAKQAWVDANNDMKALVPLVDALFPSLYTFYREPLTWELYARANLAEARRLSEGKPVYCYLWPQYQRSREFVPGPFWRMQLDTCRQMADGIVLWGALSSEGSVNRRPDWDPQAPWWLETVAFLKSVRRN